MRTKTAILSVVLLTFLVNIQAQQLSSLEKKVLLQIDQNNAASIVLLEKVVNINSGSLNVKGVKKVGDIFASEFESIGFETTWVDMPQRMGRAGHLFCELNTGTVEGKKLLLIGHLDTVFEEDSDFQEYKREGDIVYGPGVDDMKGGNIIIYAALKALYEVGALKNTQIIVAFTGDEEKAGNPISISRKDLIDAAKRSDIALGFESATGLNYATVARRSSGSWTLKTTGRRAHSSGIFSKNTGAGAIFEMSRILTAFYKELPEKNLTFNPATIVAGTSIDFDKKTAKGTTFGKTNIVPQSTIVQGDIRCLTNEQIEGTIKKMKSIVNNNNLPKTTAAISFDLRYPPMKPTEGNYKVLKVLDQLSKDMGQGPVKAFDPAKRGAGDISFVAEYVDGLDGLGTMGKGSHSPRESMDLTTFKDLTKRAAILIYRLIHTKS
ncbi:MAG: M20/M25/M40 family metallo-hydrolase [Polaribacter sp.]|nr:M20/M25/M40 family metallo-hydrolase [Polaribacter sp.]